MSRGYLTALLLACLAVLAGCTGVSPGGPAAAPPPAPRDVVAAAARGLADAGSARVEIELDSPSGPLRASGPVRFAPFAADLSAAVGTRGVRVRAVEPDAWLRLGEGRWQPISAGMLPLQAVTGALRAAPGLTGVTGPVTESETRPDGTERYAGTVDLAAARAADPAAGPALDQLAGLVSPGPRFTAWIGGPAAPEHDRGRLLRLRLEPSTGSPGVPGPVPGTVTIGFAEPGLPVDVSPPPAG